MAGGQTYVPHDKNSAGTSIVDDPSPSDDGQRRGTVLDSASESGSPVYHCRWCYASERDLSSSTLIEPCSCAGSMAYVHAGCLDRWLRNKPTGQPADACEVCRAPYNMPKPSVKPAPKIRSSLSVRRTQIRPPNVVHQAQTTTTPAPVDGGGGSPVAQSDPTYARPVIFGAVTVYLLVIAGILSYATVQTCRRHGGQSPNGPVERSERFFSALALWAFVWTLWFASAGYMLARFVRYHCHGDEQTDAGGGPRNV